jgi:hypothetical protein
MAKLVVSEFVTLDGVFEDPGGAEAFVRGGGVLEFDRGEDGDAFGERMDSIPNYVVSATLARVDWNNSTIIRSDVADHRLLDTRRRDDAARPTLSRVR